MGRLQVWVAQSQKLNGETLLNNPTNTPAGTATALLLQPIAYRAQISRWHRQLQHFLPRSFAWQKSGCQRQPHASLTGLCTSVVSAAFTQPSHHLVFSLRLFLPSQEKEKLNLTKMFVFFLFLGHFPALSHYSSGTHWRITLFSHSFSSC